MTPPIRPAQALRPFHVAFALLGLLGSGSGAFANTIDVKIQQFQFTGQHLTIQLGDTVRWTNFDTSSHTSTEGTDLVLNGNEAWHHNFPGGGTGTFSVTFDAAFLAANPRPADTYFYFCVAHTGMQGSITVVDGPGQPFCFCSPLGPCSNRDYGAGCVNSGQNRGGRMLASGTTSVAADDLQLVIEFLPVDKTCLIIRGMNQIGQTQFGEGWRCLGSPFRRMSAQNTGTNGVVVRGPRIVASTAGTIAPIVSGQTWGFQLWYRDFISQCGNATNVSNGYEVTFTP